MLLAAVSTAVWLWGVVAWWEGERTFSGDLSSYFYPKWTYGTSQLLRGRLPLWNPLESCGMPFLATAQVAVLYPVKNAVFALFVPATALQVNTVVHYVLAGAFEYAYVRWIGVGWAGALVAALAWAFSPPVFQHIYHPNQIACLAWVPLVLLAYERALLRRTIGSMAAFGLVLAVQMSAGYPLYSVCLSLVLALWTLGQLVRDRSAASAVGIILAAAGAALFAAAFAAPQALPLREMLPETMRGDIVAPWLPDRPMNLGDVLTEVLMASIETSVGFLGGLVLLGLVMGAGKRRWLLTAGFILCHTAGHSLSALSRLVPGIGDARVLWVVFDGFLPFFVATLAGVGLDVALHRPRGTRLWLALLCLIAPILLAKLRVLWLVYTLPQGLREMLAANVPFWWPLLAAPITSGIVVTALLWRRLPASVVVTAIGAIVITAALQSFWAVGEFVPYPTNGPDPLLQGVVHSASPAGRATSPTLTLDGTLLMSGIPNVLGIEGSLPPRRVGRLLEVAGMGPGAVLSGPQWAVAGQHEPLLELFALSTVITPASYPSLARQGFGLRLQLGPHAVQRRSVPRSRLFVVHAARSVSSGDEAFAAVTDNTFRPHELAIIEGPLPSLQPATTPSSALFVEDEPERVTITANMAADGIVVLADSWYPGWDAWVDGEPTSILRADYAFRGVAVPRGRHTIEFRYRPRAFWLGVLLASAAATVALGFSWQQRLRRVQRI